MKLTANFNRYLKIYNMFISSSIKLFLTHRFNFLMDVLANIVWTVSQLISLRFMFDKMTSFEGWSFQDLVLLLGFAQIYVYVSYMIYDANLSNLPKKIISGEFDRMLTKPINIKFISSFEKIVVAQLIPSTITVLPLIVYGMMGRQNLSLQNIFLAILVTTGGMITFYFLTLAIIGLSFFFDSALSIKDFLVQRTSDLSRVPITFFPKSVQLILMYIVPLAFVTYFPVLIIQGNDVISFSVISVVCLCIVFYLFQKVVWRFGLRNYSGVG